jgi:hypothetical protein
MSKPCAKLDARSLVARFPLFSARFFAIGCTLVKGRTRLRDG